MEDHSMFCSKCGHPVEAKDSFCRNCGEPIPHDTNLMKGESTHITTNKEKKPDEASALENVKLFFIYAVATIFCIGIIYSLLLPKNVSVYTFITSPHGLTSVLGNLIGMSLVVLLFCLPLISALKKLWMVKHGRTRAFFVILMLNGIGCICVGKIFWSKQLMPPFEVGAFIVGCVLLAIAHKRKNVDKD